MAAAARAQLGVCLNGMQEVGGSIYQPCLRLEPMGYLKSKLRPGISHQLRIVGSSSRPKESAISELVSLIFE